MNINLTGKRALVCGGSRGLGLASAKELASLGAEIILLSRTESKLQIALEEINPLNNLSNSIIPCDVSDIDALKKSIKNEIAANGPIHILINNSGGPAAGLIQDATPDQFLAAFNAHIIASHTLAKLLIPGMKADHYGRIINMVSTSVRQPISGLGVSNTIRGSMASWSKTLSAELAPSGITVNNILPGATNTERLEEIWDKRQQMFNQSLEEVKADMVAEVPMNRFADPEEIAAAVAFLASPAASYITGVSLPVDGGKIKSI